MRVSHFENPKARRLKLNPLEVLIFGMVVSGLSFSVYTVATGAEDFRFAALDHRQADPTRSVRMPASVESESTPANIEVTPRSRAFPVGF